MPNLPTMDEVHLEIDSIQPDQADAIVEAARNAGLFDSEEVATVNELLREYIGKGALESGYH